MKINYRKTGWILLIITVPVLAFFSVWQSYSFDSVQEKTARLEEQQRDLFEENKKTIAKIAAAKSPGRLDSVIEADIKGEMELQKMPQDRRYIVKSPEGSNTRQ